MQNRCVLDGEDICEREGCLSCLGFGVDDGLPDVVLGEVERRGDGGGASATRPAPVPQAEAAFSG